MLRLGSVPYLNALPLLEGLAEEREVDLSEAVPSRLAPRLRAGELDAALVSAVELFRDPELTWVEGPVIASRGAVRSILLFLRTRPEQVRSLALDTSSLSAAALARISLETFLGVEHLELRPASPDRALAGIDADAVLRIGDPALRTAPGDRRVLDLGELWTEHTGLPFVFALWLVRPGVAAEPLARLLLAARERGLARREALADTFAAEHDMDREACRSYLQRAIGYDLGPDERAGLALFGRLARERRLVDRAGLPPPLG